MSDRLRGDARPVLDTYTGALDCKPKEIFPSSRMVSAGSGRLLDAEIPLRPARKASRISLV